MATTTPNLGLTKPGTSDAALISVIDTNFDLLDAAVTLTGTQTLTNKTLTAPHVTSLTVDSGGIVVVAGSLTLPAGGLVVTAGGITIQTGGLTLTTSSLNVASSNGIITNTATDTVYVLPGGLKGFGVTGVATAVNYPLVQNAATGGYPKLRAQGTDSNIGMDFSGTGIGPIRFWANDLNNNLFRLSPVTAAVNYIQITNSVAGVGPSIQGLGTDTNVGITLAPQGTGTVTIPTGGLAITAGGITFGSNAATLSSPGATTATDALTVSNGTPSVALRVNSAGSVLLGFGAPATTAVAGFPYIPYMAGTPSGVPTTTGNFSGYTPMVYDNSAHKIWFYDTNTTTWRGVAVT
jgi:hypothetical protein